MIKGIQGVSIVIDCTDTMKLATFWQSIVGGEIDRATASPSWVALKGVLHLTYLGFQCVPEAKAVKNRAHIDVMVDDVESSCKEAEQLGAKALGGFVDEALYRFQVMSDPEGNEFCLVQRRKSGSPTGS